MISYQLTFLVHPNPQNGAFVWLGKVVAGKNGSRETLIHCCLISSIHANVTPSVLSIDIIPPFAIMGHFKATSFLPPCRAVIHLTQLSKCNCCQRMPPGFLHSPSRVKTCPHMASMSLPYCLLFSLLMIFSSHRDCQGYYTASFVSQLRCNRSFWSMKVLSWQALC